MPSHIPNMDITYVKACGALWAKTTVPVALHTLRVGRGWWYWPGHTSQVLNTVLQCSINASFSVEGTFC